MATPKKRAEAKRLIERYLSALDAGKENYQAAEGLLEKIIGCVAVGDVVDLAGGRTATVVDQVAEKRKVFKPCGVDRFVVKVSHAREKN